jgi:hypothetical protein
VELDIVNKKSGHPQVECGGVFVDGIMREKEGGQ